MADIPRDIGSPFDPNNPVEAREFEEFGCPPDTRQIFEDLRLNVQDSRALRLFDPNLVQGVNLGPPPPLPDDPDAVFVDFLPIPDRVAADIPDGTVDHRGLHDLTLNVPGVDEVIEIWSFRDNFTGVSSWPAPTIRLVEGRVVHAAMSNRRGPHTIHHHGIEPTPANDGVGHLTFDVGGGVVFNYQLRPLEAGTHFYHCHVNTVLHFEMGMYGMLIIDPDVTGAPFADGGPGVTYVGNDPTSYQAEAIWVADDIERRWHREAVHGLDRRAGIICGGFQSISDLENPRFHLFEPDVFVVSGQPPGTRSATGRQTVAAAGVTVARGGRILVRALNASYTTTRWRFPTAIQGQVTAADGRTLGRTPFNRYSSPFSLDSIGHQFRLTVAQRWDVLLDTTSAPTGTHLVEIDFHQWITDSIFDYGRVAIPITITA